MHAGFATALLAASALAAPSPFGFPFFGSHGAPGGPQAGPSGPGTPGPPAPPAAPADSPVATVEATATVTQTSTEYVPAYVTSTYTSTIYQPTETMLINTVTLTEWAFSKQTNSPPHFTQNLTFPSCRH